MQNLWIALVCWFSCAAWACPICSPTAQIGIAQQLVTASNVVVLSGHDNRWTPIARLRGNSDDIPESLLSGLSPTEAATGQVLVRNAATQKWDAIGSIEVAHLDWLTQVAEMEFKEPMRSSDWQTRIDFFFPALEHPDPFIAKAAYEEIARAPYEALRALKQQLNPGTLVPWIKDPKLAPHAPLYTLLLGIAGGPRATAFFDSELKASAKEPRPANLAAQLVAYLELHRLSGLRSLQKHYLRDPKRSQFEVQAALAALSLQGATDATIPRREILATYKTFIQSKHVLAGYVATDLLVWQAWDLAPDLIALHRSHAPQHPIGSYAIYNYLASNPRDDAQSAALEWRRSQWNNF